MNAIRNLNAFRNLNAKIIAANKRNVRMTEWPLIMSEFKFSSLQQLIVEHNPNDNEFYVQLGEEKAVLNYQTVRKGIIDLYHTEVPESLQGRGIAKLLAQKAFQHVVDNNLKMRVSCTYLQKYLRENPNQEYDKRLV